MITAAPSARRVLALALPALGALAAEPLYLLVDTAIVGHLGSVPLAGLAVAATVLTAFVGVATFLEYGTTGAVARAMGAGRRDVALDQAVQATWLAVLTGCAMTLMIEALAPVLIAVVGGGDHAVRDQALTWLRVAALGCPFVCVSLTGQGWLRGMQNTVTPFVVLVVANLLSAGLSAVLVGIVHTGIRGSAIANALAQSGSAVVFALALRRRGAIMRPSWTALRTQLDAARHLGIRTLAFLGSFSVATAVASRMGGSTVAAHQIAIQLWGFLALSLDSLAIAAQALIGTAVGARDIRAARALTDMLLRWGLITGVALAAFLMAGWTLIPRLFTGDTEVLSAVHAIWPYLALMQPAAAVVFVLDGVLIGAGDTAFLSRVTVAAGLGVYLPIALLAGGLHLGLGAVWLGLTAFVAVRLVTCLARARGERWWLAGVAAGYR